MHQPALRPKSGVGRLKPAYWTFWSSHQPAVFWNTTRQTKRPESWRKALSLANGVALSQDEQTLFVNETGKYRVWKISVDAKDLDISTPSDQAKVLFDNLPGYPDNLMRGLDGKIWLGLVKPRNPTIDKLATKPFHAQAHTAPAACDVAGSESLRPCDGFHGRRQGGG